MAVIPNCGTCQRWDRGTETVDGYCECTFGRDRPPPFWLDLEQAREDHGWTKGGDGRGCRAFEPKEE